LPDCQIWQVLAEIEAVLVWIWQSRPAIGAVFILSDSLLGNNILESKGLATASPFACYGS
jgi:hypothetical protein